MSHPGHIAVVILNWNGRRWLERFLPGVLEHSAGHGKVYVADNGSTDDSVAWLRASHPTVELIIIEENLGFAGGYDRALEKIDAEFFVLLNSDVEVTPGWLNPVGDLFTGTSRNGRLSAESVGGEATGITSNMPEPREGSSTAMDIRSAGAAFSRSPKRTQDSTTTNAKCSGPPVRA